MNKQQAQANIESSCIIKVIKFLGADYFSELYQSFNTRGKWIRVTKRIGTSIYTNDLTIKMEILEDLKEND